MQPKTVAFRTSILFRLDLILTIGIFAFPLLVPGPQWLTGTFVNFLLFLFVLRFPNKNILPVAVLPSLGAIGNGLLFGAYTPFLLYFLPFIWLGNIALMKSFGLFHKRVSLPAAVILSAFAKVVILYSMATIYFNFDVVPEMFVTVMGSTQLVTALGGGTICIITRNLFKSP